MTFVPAGWGHATQQNLRRHEQVNLGAFLGHIFAHSSGSKPLTKVRIGHKGAVYVPEVAVGPN